jgi:hypothetical protein
LKERNKFVTNECRAAFTERSTRSCTLFGNNTGARSLNFLYFGTDFSSRAIYLVFADLAFSGVKSLSRKNKTNFFFGPLPLTALKFFQVKKIK